MCSSCRPVVLLAAPLRAVLSAEGSLLFGSELPGADKPRGPPAAAPALPQRRNQGVAAGPAALHHPGPVSIVVPPPPVGPSRGAQRSHGVCVVTRSPVDGRLFLAYPHDSGALSQSFDRLQLFDDGGSDLVSVIIFFDMTTSTAADKFLTSSHQQTVTFVVLCLTRDSFRTRTLPHSVDSPK